MLNAAWDTDTPIARENSLPCHDRVGFNKMLESVKFPNDPDRRHLSSFAYSRLVPALMEGHNLVEFDRFVKKLHGKLKINHIPIIHHYCFKSLKNCNLSLCLCYRGSCNGSSASSSTGVEFSLSHNKKKR